MGFKRCENEKISTNEFSNLEKESSVTKNPKNDLEYIRMFMKNGLNADLDQNINTEIDKNFYTRLSWSLLVNVSKILTTIASAVTWNNHEIDPVFVGNWFLWRGIPCELCIEYSLETGSYGEEFHANYA